MAKCRAVVPCRAGDVRRHAESPSGAPQPLAVHDDATCDLGIWDVMFDSLGRGGQS